MVRTDNSAMQNSAPSPGPLPAPRLFMGLYLGADASEDGWQPLPVSQVETVEELCAQEDMLRLRNELPPRGFIEPNARDATNWDAGGAVSAVELESARLSLQRRDAERESVSVGYARGYGSTSPSLITLMMSSQRERCCRRESDGLRVMAVMLMPLQLQPHAIARVATR